MTAVNSNAVLAGIFYRVNPNWFFVKIEATGEGKDFTECEQLIKDHLDKAGFDSILFEETKNWKPQGKKFNIVKDQVFNIPNDLKSF